MRSRFGMFVLALGLLMPTSVLKAQEAEVRQSVADMIAAWEGGDFTAFSGFYHAETRGFFLDGGLLLRGFNVAALSAAYNSGFRAAMTVRDLDVKLYGDVAVSAAYLDGSLSIPGGEVIEGTWRYSDTRVQEGGQWKIVQYHFSPQEPIGGR